MTLRALKFIALAAGAACAQSYTNLSLLASIPVGSYAGSSGEGAGHAGPGLGATLEFNKELRPGGSIFWTTGASILFSFSHLEDDFHDEGAPSSLTVEGGQIFNLPLLTGIRMITPQWNRYYRAYFQGQAGGSLMTITDVEIEDGSDHESRSIPAALGLAYGLGCGLLVGHANLGLRFYGAPDRDFKVRWWGGNYGASGEEDGHMSVNMIQIVLGATY
jgi:hypothetical protein